MTIIVNLLNIILLLALVFNLNTQITSKCNMKSCLVVAKETASCCKKIQKVKDCCCARMQCKIEVRAIEAVSPLSTDLQQNILNRNPLNSIYSKSISTASLFYISEFYNWTNPPNRTNQPLLT